MEKNHQNTWSENRIWGQIEPAGQSLTPMGWVQGGGERKEAGKTGRASSDHWPRRWPIAAADLWGACSVRRGRRGPRCKRCSGAASRALPPSPTSLHSLWAAGSTCGGPARILGSEIQRKKKYIHTEKYKLLHWDRRLSTRLGFFPAVCFSRANTRRSARHLCGLSQ